MPISRNLVFILSLLIMLLGVRTSQASANLLGLENSIDREMIKTTIRDYFELRYRTFSTLQIEDFNKLVYRAEKGNPLWDLELNKLNIEIYHAKVYHLRYMQYKYYLDFREITIDPSIQSATVSVVEGHDVIFEASAPIVSMMRNRLHKISLKQENSTWTIVSDIYEDYLWRIIKTTGYTKDELMSSIDHSFSLTQSRAILRKINPKDTQSQLSAGTYQYNRTEAINYAHIYWYNYNIPKYFDFNPDFGYGGDCTNFVSQAIFEGGGAMMAYPQNYQPGVGNPGWYYVSVNDRSKAWTEVNWFYTVTLNIEQGVTWLAGPDGVQVSDGDYTLEGDVIEYNWDNDAVWDHAAIIVGYRNPDWEYLPLVASHDEDHYNYPYNAFTYNNVRFIHIRWNRGYHASLPVVMNNQGGTMNLLQNVPLNPYPAPLDSAKPILISPYPLP
jgi:hypothetical protein